MSALRKPNRRRPVHQPLRDAAIDRNALAAQWAAARATPKARKLNTDPELYNEELAWFFLEFDSECGMHSIPLSKEQVVCSQKKSREDRDGVVRKAQKPSAAGEPLPWDDRHVTFTGPEGVFTRGRRIWNQLVRLPWAMQQALKSHYEPRRPMEIAAGEPSYGPPPLNEEDVRAAHLAFNRERGR